MGDDTTLAALGEPQVLAGVLGAQPGQDTAEFILATMGSNSLGNPTVIKGTSLSITARATISTALVYEVTSVVSFSGKSQGDGLAAGGLAEQARHPLRLGAGDLRCPPCRPVGQAWRPRANTRA